jgi:fructose-bisphosphate aldolase class II
MTLANVLALAHEAKERHYCLGSFNAFNLETARAAVDGAEALHSPVVIAFAASHLQYTDFEAAAEATRVLAERASVPVALHLDHAETLDVVGRALRAGFTSVMFDGYGLSAEEKVRQTRSVTDIAHSIGVAVEAELGHITKVGVDETDRAQLLIDADRIAEFVEATRVDIVAAAIGSVHGQEEGTAKLDFGLLHRIQELSPCLLSLHGGSGMGATDIAAAREAGVVKISYFTGLSRAATAAVQRELAGNPGIRVTELMQVVKDAMQGGVERQLRLFGSAGSVG